MIIKGTVPKAFFHCILLVRRLLSSLILVIASTELPKMTQLVKIYVQRGTGSKATKRIVKATENKVWTLTLKQIRFTIWSITLC